MVKVVDMREALQQVREKAPNTADAMKRFKSGNAGFTDKAHLKAKGLIPRADGTKKKSPKYEDLDKGDEKTIKPIIKQLKKSVIKHDKQAKTLEKDIADEKDLEEQVADLENQIAEAKKELEEIRLDEEQVGIAYRDETGKIPKGMIKVSEVNEWLEDKPGKNELDYVKEYMTKTELAPGDYIIGKRVVTVDENNKVSYFY